MSIWALVRVTSSQLFKVKENSPSAVPVVIKLVYIFMDATFKLFSGSVAAVINVQLTLDLKLLLTGQNKI